MASPCPSPTLIAPAMAGGVATPWIPVQQSSVGAYIGPLAVPQQRQQLHAYHAVPPPPMQSAAPAQHLQPPLPCAVQHTVGLGAFAHGQPTGQGALGCCSPRILHAPSRTQGGSLVTSIGGSGAAPSQHSHGLSSRPASATRTMPSSGGPLTAPATAWTGSLQCPPGAGRKLSTPASPRCSATPPLTSPPLGLLPHSTASSMPALNGAVHPSIQAFPDLPASAASDAFFIPFATTAAAAAPPLTPTASRTASTPVHVPVQHVPPWLPQPPGSPGSVAGCAIAPSRSRTPVPPVRSPGVTNLEAAAAIAAVAALHRSQSPTSAPRASARTNPAGGSLTALPAATPAMDARERRSSAPASADDRLYSPRDSVWKRYFCDQGNATQDTFFHDEHKATSTTASAFVTPRARADAVASRTDASSRSCTPGSATTGGLLESNRLDSLVANNPFADVNLPGDFMSTAQQQRQLSNVQVQQPSSVQQHRPQGVPALAVPVAPTPPSARSRPLSPPGSLTSVASTIVRAASCASDRSWKPDVDADVITIGSPDLQKFGGCGCLGIIGGTSETHPPLDLPRGSQEALESSIEALKRAKSANSEVVAAVGRRHTPRSRPILEGDVGDFSSTGDAGTAPPVQQSTMPTMHVQPMATMESCGPEQEPSPTSENQEAAPNARIGSFVAPSTSGAASSATRSPTHSPLGSPEPPPSRIQGDTAADVRGVGRPTPAPTTFPAHEKKNLRPPKAFVKRASSAQASIDVAAVVLTTGVREPPARETSGTRSKHGATEDSTGPAMSRQGSGKSLRRVVGRFGLPGPDAGEGYQASSSSSAVYAPSRPRQTAKTGHSSGSRAGSRGPPSARPRDEDAQTWESQPPLPSKESEVCDIGPDSLDAPAEEEQLDPAFVDALVAELALAAGALEMRCLHEMRSFRHPPQTICQVVEAAATLLGLPETGWPALRRRMDSAFLQRITAWDLSAATRCPRIRTDRFLRLLQSTIFSDTSLPDKCPAAAPLAAWCVAAGRLLDRLQGDDRTPSHGSPADYVGGGGPYDGSDRHAKHGEEQQLLQQHLQQKQPSRSPRRSGPTEVVEEECDASRLLPADSVLVADNISYCGGSPSAATSTTATASAPPLELGGLIVAPELWRLTEAELACVKDLQVSREGVGHVTFHGDTDCRGLLPQLRELLIVEQGEVVAYPDPRLKPPVGRGLNKAATVVLYGCMPKSRTRLADSEARERYKQRVAHMTEEKGAVFEDYDCDTGTWTFRVNHF